MTREGSEIRMTHEEAWARHVQELGDDEKERRRRLGPTVVELDAPAQGEPELHAELRQELRVARDRVGRSNDERARWLVRFASLDTSKLAAGDWLNLEYDVLVFASPAPAGSVEVVLDAATDEREPIGVQDLHAWVRSGLLGPHMIDAESQAEPQMEGGESRPIGWRVDVHILPYEFSWVNGRFVGRSMAAGGSTKECFQVQVYNTLRSQASKVRRCQRCDQVFIATRRQAYCSRRCSQTVRTAKYRARNPEKVNQWRANAYEREVRKEHPMAKIRHRRKADVQPNAQQEKTKSAGN